LPRRMRDVTASTPVPATGLVDAPTHVVNG
jgi:hypothetical protein